MWQVYVRSESSEQHQQAAQQALHDHCQPLLHPTPTPGTPAPPQQLSLVKPCAWPFPVTASHFAEEAASTTLARDAALWEGYCATLAGGGGDTQQQQQQQQPHVLQLLWKAAACFAERASWGDRTQRQLWSALTAEDLQVSAAHAVTLHGSKFCHLPLAWRMLPKGGGGTELQGCPRLHAAVMPHQARC